MLGLRPPGGLVRAWANADERVWIEAPLGTLPDWTLVQLDSRPKLRTSQGPFGLTMISLPTGPGSRPGHEGTVLRARFEIARTKRPARRSQAHCACRNADRDSPGRGSLLFARPIYAERAEVGGLVVEDEPLHVVARSPG